MANQYVLPHRNGWAVREEGAKRASRVFKKKDDAVHFARQLAEKSGGSYFVQRRDVHVIPFGSEWAVKSEQTSKVGSKYEAIRIAHRIADTRNVSMVVHRDDGKVSHVDKPPHFPSFVADLLHLRRRS